MIYQDGSFMLRECPITKDTPQYIHRTRWASVTEAMPEKALPEGSQRLMIPCLVARAGNNRSVTKLMRMRKRLPDGTFTEWRWPKNIKPGNEPTHWCLCPKAPFVVPD